MNKLNGKEINYKNNKIKLPKLNQDSNNSRKSQMNSTNLWHKLFKNNNCNNNIQLPTLNTKWEKI